MMISWIYLVLVSGIVLGIAHFFMNMTGTLLGVFINVVARGKVVKEPRFADAGLWVASICFMILTLYGSWDIFSHFFSIQAK